MAGLKRTPLYDLHRELGAKLVDFAGWEMPVQYAGGILKEHNQCRKAAALFDVSHMGQVLVRGPGAAEAFERLVPGNIKGLGAGRMRYTVLTNDQGGIIDDLMVANADDGDGGGALFVVVNAARRGVDIPHMRAGLGDGHAVLELDDRALLALQGPAAEDVLSRFTPDAADLPFMASAEMSVGGTPCRVSRSGYTGEDGFEISVPADEAEALARRLLDEPEVAPVGLGARDSLRLEAGLCLYGHDIDGGTTPVEAGLSFTIAKRRREEGGFPGADVILRQLKEGPPRKLVGLKPDGKAPAREHTEIQDQAGGRVGEVTSGGFGPTAGGPVAMGYVDPSCAEPGTVVHLVVRGRSHPARVAALPFVPHRYKR